MDREARGATVDVAGDAIGKVLERSPAARTIRAITTFAPEHWDSHARRCVETFSQHWPAGIELQVLSDYAVEEKSGWLRMFKRLRANTVGKSFKFDAVRFSHKVAAMEIAYDALQSDGDVLIWIDADCVTHDDVTVEWLDTLFPADADLALLLRTYSYSETGFIMFRRNCRTTDFLRRVVSLYTSGELFGLQQWHDSFAIDHIRRACEREIGLRVASLSGIGVTTNHPLVNGPLGEKLDHLKGRRKALGKSKPTDLVVPRTETYWKTNEG